MGESANSHGSTDRMFRPVTEMLKRKLRERLLEDTIKRSRLLLPLSQQQQLLLQHMPTFTTTATTSSSRCGEHVWQRNVPVPLTVKNNLHSQSSPQSDNSKLKKKKKNKTTTKKKCSGEVVRMSDGQLVNSCVFIPQLQLLQQEQQQQQLPGN